MDNKYYDNYRRFTYNFSYEDQEEYSKYEEELENIEAKEVISDEEYNNNISRLEATNDMEELERYRNQYISESEYYFTREELLENMRSIETMYRVSEEQLAEDRRMRAMYSRDRLRLLKRSYENRGITGAMRNVDVDLLSDEEAIEMYRNVRHGMSVENERQLGDAGIRERVSRFISPSVSNVDENENSIDESFPEMNSTFDEIENELERFRNTSDRINRQIQVVNRKLILGDSEEINVSLEIDGLSDELRELREMADVIVSDMDAFRLSTEAVDFSMSVSEIRKTVKGFTDRFKELKVLQVEKYNSRVEATNNRINELKKLTNLEPEVLDMINGLPELSKCNVRINSWNQTNYLGHLNYEELEKVNRVINEVNSRLNMEVPTPKVEGIDGDISYIDSELERLDTEILENMEREDVNRLNQDLDVLVSNIDNFELKLESNKDSLTEDEYNSYKDKIENAKSRIEELRSRLNKHLVQNNDYDELNNNTSNLEKDVQRLVEDVETFYGHIVNGSELLFLNRLNVLKSRLGDLKTEVEVRHNDGKMDVNQFNSLMDRVSEMENKLSQSKNKLRDPGMIKDADIYSVLNGEIDGLENALTSLEEQVESLEKPIDKDDRKKIDSIVKHIESEVKRLEKLLEQYKEKDSEKYNFTMNRLNNVNERLDKLGKNYRSKCPLMVKAVKDAKNFYKKHKKVILIVAGLSALALVAHQVLIPAIMHGNIMIAYSSPALRPFIKFCDKILGGMIGATLDVEGIWTLANGVAINPSVAATSLLKGLAISGVASTALVAPLVVAIKKLVEKMKTTELKMKLTEEKDKLAEKVKTNKDKISGKIKEGKDKFANKNDNKKADKDAVGRMASLFKEYRNSFKSLDYLEMNSNEYNNSGRKGR